MMKQAWHIFLKDTRRQRFALLALAAWIVLLTVAWLSSPFRGLLYAVNGAYVMLAGSEIVLPAFWCLLTAQAVHADSLAGDRQFWVTRPYRRSSLFLAKATFLVAYVVLPLSVAQLTVLLARGFSLSAALPALVWEQVLVLLLWILPAAAISTVTTSLVQFIPPMLVVPIVLSATFGVNSWGPFGWIRYAAAMAVAFAGSVAVVALQFRRRRTVVSRVLGLSASLGAVACLAFLPWRSAFALQSALGQPNDAVGAVLRMPAIDAPGTPSRLLRFDFDITGLAPRTALLCETGELTIVLPDGRRWHSGLQDIAQSRGTAPGISFVEDGCSVSAYGGSLPDEFQSQSVDVFATVVLTILGDEHRTAVENGRPPARVRDVGVCSSRIQPFVSDKSREMSAVICDTAFRRPRPFVQFQAGAAFATANVPRSYSPFPSELQLIPFETTGATFNQPSAKVDVITRSPLMHAVRTVPIRGIRLEDYQLRIPPRGGRG